MSRSLKNTLIKYSISFGLSLAIAWLYAYLRLDLSNLGAVPKTDLYRILCDACTVPGLLLLMSGLLMTISNQGALDGLGYVAVNGLKMLIPGAAQKMETFRDYLLRRRENRVKGYGFLYVTAAAFLAAAGVFMALFYSVYRK